jgi:tetratricopeptide (TPR) repeat protein
MQERQILESWKEIAGYLKRSIRTCRRWEAELELPIHRLDGTPSARVFAYADELDRWLAEKLNHVKIEAKSPAMPRILKRKWLLSSAGVLIVLTALVILAPSLLSPSLLPIPPNKPSLAIVQFENASGDESFEPWRTALPDMMITDLVQSRFVSVVRITDLYRGLRDIKLAEAEKFSSEDLKRIADRAKVGSIATGSLSKAGQDMTITVKLQNPKTSEVIKSLTAIYRNEGDIFAAVDELTKKIKLGLNLTPRYVSRDIDEDVSHIATRSPQAFRLFSQGSRLAGIEKYQESISLLQKAVEIDPKFSLAYKHLFRVCFKAFRDDDAKKYCQKAIDSSARLSKRERGELEFLYYDYYDQGNKAKMKAALERLCRFYPDDRFGTVNLLASYLGLEEWEKALPIAQGAWPTNRTDFNLCQQLAICYANLGRMDKAEDILDEFISINPDHRFLSSAFDLRFSCYIWQNKLDSALAEINRLISQYPNNPNYVGLKCIVYLYQNNFSAADSEIQKFFERTAPTARLNALILLGDLFLAQGKIEEAKQELRRGIEMFGQMKIDPKKETMLYIKERDFHQKMAYLHRLEGQLPQAVAEVEEALRIYERNPVFAFGIYTMQETKLGMLHLRALITMEMGRMEEFSKQADEIKRFIERKRQPKLMKFYYHLLGHRELLRKNFEGAIDFYSKALDLVSIPGSMLNEADPLYFYSLAVAYDQLLPPLAASSRAFSEYEKVTMPVLNRLYKGDIYARSFFKMAKYYEAAATAKKATTEEIKSNRDKAIKNYMKFLSLWGNADAIFAPEVDEARARLAALESK